MAACVIQLPTPLSSENSRQLKLSDYSDLVRSRQRAALFESRERYKWRRMINQRGRFEVEYDNDDDETSFGSDIWFPSPRNDAEFSDSETGDSPVSSPIPDTEHQWGLDINTEEQSPRGSPQPHQSNRRHKLTGSARVITASKLSPRHHGKSDEDIRNDFEQLTSLLYQSHNDAQHLNELIFINWSVLSESLQHRSTATDAMDVLSALVNQNIITSKTLIHMLQNGLISALSMFTQNLASSYEKPLMVVFKLVTNIPECIPYIVDLMSKTPLLDHFEDCVGIGTTAEQRLVMDFYHYISEHQLSQLCSDISSQQQSNQDTLPGFDTSTYAPYGPMSTLTKLFRPARLINEIPDAHIRRDKYRDPELINKSLLVMANIIKMAIMYASIPEASRNQYTDWLIDTLQSIERSDLAKNLTIVQQHCERIMRLDEGSDHSSQGVGVDLLAMTVRERCEQFLSFYNEFYLKMTQETYAGLLRQTANSSSQLNGWID